MTFEKLRQFVVYVRWLQESDLDVFLIGSAPKGFGKSSFIIQCSREYVMTFGLRCGCGHEWMFTGKAIEKGKGGLRIKSVLFEVCPKCGSDKVERVKRLDFRRYLAYDTDDVEKLIYELPEYSPWMGDEGVRIMMGEDWMKSESKNMKRLFAQMRTKHLFGMVNIQKFEWIESKYRDDMTNFWVRILKRGLVVLLQPDLGEAEDPWHLKKFRELLGSYFYFTDDSELVRRAERLVSKHPCVYDWFKVPPVPADLYADYLKVRNEKAFERKKAEDRIDQKQMGKVAAWNLMNKWQEINEAIKEGRFERPTFKVLENHVFCHPKSREPLIGNTAIKYWVDDVQKAVEK